MRDLLDKKITYNYCGICGRVPNTKLDEPNYTPMRWWDADDGWKIGTLCRACWNEFGGDRPSPKDYAYDVAKHVASHVNVDEDIHCALDKLEKEL